MEFDKYYRVVPNISFPKDNYSYYKLKHKYTTGSKGASVSKLGGKNNIEFCEDSSGNVYALSIGIYFIQIIGYNTFNIIDKKMSDYPADCTTLVVE